MSEREQKIIESISDALPKMSEFDKGYLLGSAERMVSEKEKTEKENKDKKAGQEVRKMRKTTLAIYKWNDNNGWEYVGCTPISKQAEHIISCLEEGGIKAKAVLRYL